MNINDAVEFYDLIREYIPENRTLADTQYVYNIRRNINQAEDDAALVNAVKKLDPLVDTKSAKQIDKTFVTKFVEYNVRYLVDFIEDIGYGRR